MEIGTRKVTSKDLKGTKVNKAFKDVMDVKGSKDQLDATDVMAQQVVMDAMVKTY